MPISVVSPTPAFADATFEFELELPAHAAAISQMTPMPALGTAWQQLYTEQLVTVLQDWFRSGSFSRRNRRAYAKLNLVVRSVAAGEPGEHSSQR
jgi:hypothetical protein